jgi:hypothetical protein
MYIRHPKRFFFILAVIMATGILASSAISGTPSEKVEVVHDNVKLTLQRELAGAHLAVDVAVSDLRDRQIANYLVLAHRRGALVRVILDGEAVSHQGTQDNIRFLQENEIPVMLTKQKGFLHQSVMVIDVKKVLTGSFSYLGPKESVDDMAIIQNAQVALQESQWFHAMWNDPAQVELAK